MTKSRQDNKLERAIQATGKMHLLHKREITKGMEEYKGEIKCVIDVAPCILSFSEYDLENPSGENSGLMD